MAIFSAAIFDLDGTITASPELHLLTFNEVLKEYNIKIDRKTWFSLYEGTGAKHIFEDLLAKRGLLSKVDVEGLRKKRRALFRDLAMKQLIPVKGFANFLDQLEELRVPCIVATNGNDENVKLSLQILKITELPRVTADEAGSLKPSPDVYILACKRIGKSPEECVVFEDSVYGVIAAKRAGCYCVALLTTTERTLLEDAGADLIVKDYNGISPGMLFAKK